MTAPVLVGPSPSGGGPVPFTPRLTARQLEVLRLAANGHTNKEISRRLGTTEDTVKSQMAALLRRLHVENRTQAVSVGTRLGLVSLDAVTVSPRPERAPRRVKIVENSPVADDLDDELADIGDRIRAERKARGLSEVALAERAGLARDTLRRIQDGVGTIRHFMQVCSALGVDPGYLLSDRWVIPETVPPMAEAQVRVLRAVATGDPIAKVAARLGMTPRAVGSHLTRIYQRLGVSELPVGKRRAAAVRLAMQHGLFNLENRTS